ncbi:LysR substrate-binding domain-containing protein, partial [Bradyrhizobium uaiense]|uniref:LysR substrate-binding domain-containing protein n=1 Tax=Bradyrhizobium uaiense TaxID=2594946 RepID=UPI001F28546F
MDRSDDRAAPSSLCRRGRRGTRAAARLGIQQPPLSQQIRALEAAIGAPLFRRQPRGVELTAAGRAFVDRARAILRDTDLAVEAARRASRGQEGQLAIGFTSSAAFHPFVTGVMREMRERAPAITLSLEEASTGELIEAVEADRLDAAFVRSPSERLENLTITHLLDEEMLVALPDHHSRARKDTRRRISLASLADEPLILYRRPTGPGLYDSIIAACRAAGFSPKVAQEATRMVSTLSLVAAGLGISIVPESMARRETAGVSYLRLDRAAPLARARKKGPAGGTRGRLPAHV